LRKTFQEKNKSNPENIHKFIFLKEKKDPALAILNSNYPPDSFL